MEVGYDYLLMRSRLQQRFLRVSGIFLAVTGGILLSAGIAYFVYAQQAHSDLDKLNYVVPGTESGSSIGVPGASSPSSSLKTEQPFTAPLISPATSPDGIESLYSAPDVIQPQTPQGVVSSVPPSQSLEVGQSPQASEVSAPEISAADIASRQLYPGESLQASYWSNPLEYEPPSYVESSLLQGFKSVDPNSLPTVGTLPSPTRLLIPAIGVDSSVTALQILDLGDSRAYETPKQVVGHIPELANPGEDGSSWFFGHLESPLGGEGNVFYDLPKIPDLLRKGRDVYTIAYSGSKSYLYRITETRVIHQDDMKLFDSGGANIHLVVCVPRFVYDHRLIVTGVLVGVSS